MMRKVICVEEKREQQLGGAWEARVGRIVE